MKPLVRGLLACSLATSASFASAASPDEDIVLLKYLPTQMKWGEISFGETTRIVARTSLDKGNNKDGTPKEFPNGCVLRFTVRSRSEPAITGVSDTLGDAAVTRSHDAGAIYVAAQVENMREWERFRSHILATAGKSRPEAYTNFVGGFSGNVPGQFQPSGPSTMLICTSTGEPNADRATLIDQKVQKAADGTEQLTGGLTSPRDPAPMCDPLQDAMRDLPPSQVLTSSFSIEKTLEEKVQVRWVDSRQQPVLSWPAGAKMSMGAAPDGASNYESTAVKDGIAHFEKTRTRRNGDDPATREPASTLIADAAPARLSSHLTAGSCLLSRWTLSLQLMRLGSSFSLESEDRHDVVVGVFFTDKSETLHQDEFQAAVGHDLDSRDGALTMADMRKAIRDNILELGAEQAFVVICAEGKKGEDEAEYCVAKACAAVLNPKETCAELRSATDE